jgi:hypothetical protein
MTRLFGVHLVELREGVSAAEFEEFLRTEWKPAPIPGIKTSFVKGERGEQAGRYLVGTYLYVSECDTATRDRYWPSAGPEGASAEWQAVQGNVLNSPEQRRIRERLATLATVTENYTDWVVVAE